MSNGAEAAAIRAVFGAVISLLGLFFAILRFLFRLILHWHASRPKPFNFRSAPRFQHTHIVAGSGHGKTQLLQLLILDDIAYMKQGEKATVIVIDSQGDMIRKILHLAMMKNLADRLILIDPNDMEYPPALNLFDFGWGRIEQYSPVEREKLLNGAIDLYEYLFGALLGAELTARQGVIFRYLARLLMVVPGANIHALIAFMAEPETVRPHLAKLDATTRLFFTTQFFSSSFDNTRQQILMRLWAVMSRSNVLARMFNHEHNKLDLFNAMNRGSIILINTAKDLLKQDGCELLGRFFIALISQATQERASIPEDKRTPTFVYIDEAQDYFDEKRMEDLLTQARKYKVGLVLAHQNLGQLGQKLRSTILTNTSIKIVGGLSADDAAVFAREMRCEESFIYERKKHESYTEFACFVRDYSNHAFPLDVHIGVMEAQPRLTDEQYRAIEDANRRRYSAPLVEVADRPEGVGEALSKSDML